MLERFNPVLRILCLGLAGLLVFQFSRLVTRKDPLDHWDIQSSLSSSPAADHPTERKETNTVSFPPSGKKATDVPPALQARIEKITQSETFGTIARPIPMALLGIAGKDAFLRAPNGQTGLLKEGEELGGVKVLRIGTNRVLVEHEQQKKELTVFSGFGSETLLPKGEKKQK